VVPCRTLHDIARAAPGLSYGFALMLLSVRIALFT